MSDVIYPISLIQQIDIQRMDRTLVDEFEDGSTNTRRYWAAQEFKRRLMVSHGHLTPQEFRYLRSFNSARSGQYDSFWFRDNIHRGGNIKARFASPLPAPWAAGAREIRVALDEVAPIRALPEFDELATAAGTTPFAWYDANRELYLSHMGSVTSNVSNYDVMENYHLPWGGTGFSLGGYASQYQYYAGNAASNMISAGNVSQLSTTQPACTLFAIVRHTTIAAQRVIGMVGGLTGTDGLGIKISASNYYEPWLGGSESYTNAKSLNSAIDTWRSVAVVWTGASNSVTLYVNGASIGTDSIARSYAAGKIAVHSSVAGTFANNGDTGHFIAVAGALTLAQVKAVHNLLGYQYGLATV
jgi:hypothetical protein